MALAGLWENWRSPAGKWIRSFAIVTTKPNELCAELHDRVPVGERSLDLLRWGFVPFWAKDLNVGFANYGQQITWRGVPSRGEVGGGPMRRN